MSQKNIEIARRSNAAFNEGDLDTALEMFAPDAELCDLINAPDQAEAVKGIEAIREAMTLWAAAFDALSAETEEWVDAGDAVIADVRWVGTGKGSGISIDVRQFDLYQFRDQKVIRATLGLRSRQEALDAAAGQR